MTGGVRSSALGMLRDGEGERHLIRASGQDLAETVLGRSSVGGQGGNRGSAFVAEEVHGEAIGVTMLGRSRRCF